VDSKAKLLGHPIHQMLAVFPLGLLSTAVIFDVLAMSTGNRLWFVIYFWMMAAGVIGGVAAAAFGFVDHLAIPHGSRAKMIGYLHGGGSIVVLTLFGFSWFMRRETPQEPQEPSLMSPMFSFTGVGLAIFTAWLGGELVTRLGVGVDDGAHLDAPSFVVG
jgi:uncharacterized membrane protein